MAQLGPGEAFGGDRGRRLRWLGLLAFLLTAVLPVHGFSPASPRAHPGRPLGRSPYLVEGHAQMPAGALARQFEYGMRQEGVAGGVWHARTWYTYLLVPVWVVALVLASRGGSIGRRAAGAVLVAVSASIAVLEAFYVRRDYEALLPGRWGRLEVALAWVGVCAILFWRPRGRRLGDVEAAVSAQALLAFCHALTFPVHDLRVWVQQGWRPEALADAVLSNYAGPFWLAAAGLLAVAAPAYVPTRWPGRRPSTLTPTPALSAEASG